MDYSVFIKTWTRPIMSQMTSFLSEENITKILLPVLPAVVGEIGIHFSGKLGLYMRDRILTSHTYSSAKSVIFGLTWGTCSISEIDIATPTSSTTSTNCPEGITSTTLDLPYNIRTKVWSFMEGMDVSNLRLVCRQLHQDMDLFCGICIIIDGPIEWIHTSLDVERCLVKKLNNPLHWQFFRSPHVLQYLKVDKDFPVTPEMMVSILSNFHKLKLLIVYIPEDSTAPGDGCNITNFQYILNLLDTRPALSGLEVKLYACKWYWEWKMRFNKDSVDETFTTEANATIKLQHIVLNIPMIGYEHQSFWFNFLERQKYLKVMVCNLGEVHWTKYKSLIYINCKTLTILSLSNVTSWIDNFSFQEKAFNCEILKRCKNLQELELVCNIRYSGESRSRHMPFINGNQIPTDNLNSLKLIHVSIAKADVFDATKGMKNLKTGYLKNCLVDGIPVACVLLPIQ